MHAHINTHTHTSVCKGGCAANPSQPTSMERHPHLHAPYQLFRANKVPSCQSTHTHTCSNWVVKAAITLTLSFFRAHAHTHTHTPTPFSQPLFLFFVL